jgi:hypothetical protein
MCVCVCVCVCVGGGVDWALGGTGLTSPKRACMCFQSAHKTDAGLQIDQDQVMTCCAAPPGVTPWQLAGQAPGYQAHLQVRQAKTIQCRQAVWVGTAPPGR